MKRATKWGVVRGRRHVAAMHMASGRQHTANLFHRLMVYLKNWNMLDFFVWLMYTLVYKDGSYTCLNKLLQGKLR